MHVASSILDMKDIKRAGPTNVYLQNRDELHFSNKVVIDSDVAASQMVWICYYLSTYLFSTFSDDFKK